MNMEIDEQTFSTSNNPNIPSTTSNVSSSDNVDSDEYEEEESYIIIDLGTEVTLDMITKNFEILNNINPSSFNFNQNRHHQNQDSLSSSTSYPQQQSSNFDLNDNTINETSNATASTSSSATIYSQKSFHGYVKPPTVHENESGEPSNFDNKKENNDIDCSLIGLDTDTPYLRIGNIHFKGEYDETIGTDLIFFPEPDQMNPRQQKLTYQCQTTKKIKFSQVNLQEINLDTTNELNQLNFGDDNVWGDEYSINNYSLDDSELFNIKSYSDEENEISSQNDVSSVVVDKGKRKEVIDQVSKIQKKERDEHLDY